MNDMVRSKRDIDNTMKSQFLEGSGDIKLEEVKALAFLLFGMCNWTHHWYDPRGPIVPDRLSRMIRTVFLYGITGPSQGKKRGGGSAVLDGLHDPDL